MNREQENELIVTTAALLLKKYGGLTIDLTRPLNANCTFRFLLSDDERTITVTATIGNATIN